VAAPEFVPTDPARPARIYKSPPRRPDSWIADRPGELNGPPPSGPALGTAGPDQGYAYKLVRQFDDRLHLLGVHKPDAIAGCVELAMKRSALYGRAPVIHDLTAAFTIWGFLDADPAVDLVNQRSEMFAEIASHHHYFERRKVVDAVREEWLKKPPAAIKEQYDADWTELFQS
jgi:hypothetical protein